MEKDTCPSSKMASEGSLPRSSLSTSTRGAGSIDKASWAEPGRFMRCYLCTGVHDLGASAPSFRPHLSAITAPCSPCCSWPTAGLELWDQPLHPPTCSLTSKSVKTEFQQLSSRSPSHLKTCSLFHWPRSAQLWQSWPGRLWQSIRFRVQPLEPNSGWRERLQPLQPMKSHLGGLLQ